MSLTLFTYPGNFRAFKCQIAALYNGLTLDVQDNKELENQKAPVLRTKNGDLSESNAIAAYVAGLGDSELLGTTRFEQAQIRQWVDFSAFDIEPQRAVWLLPVREVITFNGKAYAQAKKDLKASLTLLNNHLQSNTFLVGNRVTLADITVACALVEPFQELFDNNFKRGLENVTRWFLTCVNQNEFVQVLGKVNLCKKENQAPRPKKQNNQQKSGNKQEAKKPAAAKKPSKPKNPLDLLPKSSMNLDVVKKDLFSLKGKREGQPLIRGPPNFFKELFDGKFDNEGYSFWTGHYDYNTDNTIFWKTQNAVSFYIQRMDALRKYGFAVFNVLGNGEEDKYFEICALFCVRGTQKIPFELEDVPDSDYYKFNKVDVTTKEGQQLVEDYFYSLKLEGNPKDKKGSLNVLDRSWFK